MHLRRRSSTKLQAYRSLAVSPPNKRLKLTGHRALQTSVLLFGHETRRFQPAGHL